MTDPHDVRTAAWLGISGALLSLVGNVLHPFIDASTTEEFLAAVSDAGAIWAPVHFMIAVAIVLLTVALVIVARILRGTAGERLGRIAAVMGLVTGPVFFGQVAGIDGTALKTLADDAANGDRAAIATADALVALDFGLLTVSITFFLGATLVVFGLAVIRGAIVPAWAAWLITAGGAVSLTGGLTLWVAPDNGFALDVLFRGGALVSTIGVLSMGELLRRKATVRSPAPAVA